MTIRWHRIPIYGGLIAVLSPLLWVATYYFWWWLAPAFSVAPTLFGGLYALLALVLTLGCVLVPIWGIDDWSHHRGFLPLPTPHRVGKQEKLELRLGECLETKAEVEKALNHIRNPDSAFAVTLRARLNELEGAEESIKADMAGEALTALNRKAMKIVKRELKA